GARSVTSTRRPPRVSGDWLIALTFERFSNSRDRVTIGAHGICPMIPMVRCSWTADHLPGDASHNDCEAHNQVDAKDCGKRCPLEASASIRSEGIASASMRGT